MMCEYVQRSLLSHVTVWDSLIIKVIPNAYWTIYICKQ